MVQCGGHGATLWALTVGKVSVTVESSGVPGARSGAGAAWPKSSVG